MSQLRIAMLSVHSCPIGNLGARDTGGMSVYVREMAKELGKQGLLVDVYTRLHSTQENQIVGLGDSARLVHLRAGGNEEVHKLALYSYLPEFTCNLETFRRQNGLAYDLVFSHYWLSGWVGRYLARWWGVPHAMMFHTLGAAKNAIGLGEEEPELRLDTERGLVSECQLIIAATDRERADLLYHYHASPASLTVIPCGVDLGLFQPMDKTVAKWQLGLDGERVILFVGRIDPLKGIDQLLKAAVYLKKSPGPRLIIVGGDEQSQEIERLEKLCRDLQILDSVSFLGTVRHEELPYFYNAADVCVIPSYYETFGLVALESLACGTPVVASDVGAARKIIHEGKNGYVVADNRPRYLADKINLILSRPGLVMSAVSIRASVSSFSWSTIAREVIEQFNLLRLRKERGHDGRASGYHGD